MVVTHDKTTSCPSALAHTEREKNLAASNIVKQISERMSPHFEVA